MQVDNDITTRTQRKTLRDFIPLVLAFFGGLVVLSIYQNLRLYFSGVLDSVFNKSFWLLVLHHTGFTALAALFLAFLFNYLENQKAGSGVKIIKITLIVLLGIEGFLIAFYVQNYEILGVDIYGISDSENIRFFLLPIVLMLLLTTLIFHYLHKVAASFYTVISRMYPFTIILFSLFLATLNSDKKPVNENKTQYLISSIVHSVFDFNTYDGKLEYPLLKPYKKDNSLVSHFNLKEQKPDIVVLIIEGLGSDFIGDKSRFKGFAPKLDSLRKKSLYWKNFVSNSGTGFASFPMIVGSLPFGESGFTNIKNFTNRHTLYSILKKNGYTTSFNYGGNSALNHIDKFLDEERVDFILDRNAFGTDYQLQEEDAAGISLGYADDQLFKKWNSQSFASTDPKFNVFLTLSTKNPFLVPGRKRLESKVKQLLPKLELSNQAKRLIRKNEEVFASMLYADTAIYNFIQAYEKRPEFQNTIFIITGTHNLTDLPQVDELGRYRVPFMIYSPLLKSTGTINTLASHADIAPSLVSLLDVNYELNIPKQVAWLGNSLITNRTFNIEKNIPLFRDINNIQDFIKGKHYVSSSEYYQLDKDINLSLSEDEDSIVKLKNSFNYFKSINKYITENDKIIPQSESLLASTKTDFSKTEIIWVESVFNGIDFDNAYNTARNLAFDKDWDRALLLCKYILNKTPRHADTEILMGRIYSWQKQYTQSEEVLKEAIRKYPKYEDAYAALLDTYFWANTNEKTLALLDAIERNGINTENVKQKITRAKHHISKESTLGINPNPPKENLITTTSNE